MMKTGGLAHPPGSPAPLQCWRDPGAKSAFGFTLIEIMVVIGILAIVMTMTIPNAFRALQKEPMRRAVRDVIEVCSHARARAILNSTRTEVIFRPLDRQLAVGGAAASSSDGGGISSGTPAGNSKRKRSGLSAVIDESITIEMLDVNLVEFKDEEAAVVRFFANGTCDEMTLILHSDKDEWRKISLEVTTGLASVERDPQKWR